MPFTAERENGNAQSAALGDKSDVAASRKLRRECGIQLHCVFRIDDSHAVGADHAHAVNPDLFGQLPFEPRAFIARFLEPGGDYDKAADAFCAAFIDGGEHLVTRHNDDCQIDFIGDLSDRTITFDAVNKSGFRIDWKQFSLESVFNDV